MGVAGTSVAHDSAVGHVTGESAFLDDVPPLHGELIASIVPSPLAHGRLISIDVSAARAIPGVHAVLTAADIKGHNKFGPVFKDENLIVPVWTGDDAEQAAMFVGQPLAILAAENAAALDAARKAVRFEMTELPPIFTIDEAIERESFIGKPRQMARGDVDAGFAQADDIIEGTLDVGGQEHFYLESMICVVVPGEGRTMTVHSSTQHPSEVQAMVAEVLHVPFNHVIAICRRMGGGFGGKETQAATPAMMAALLAERTKRPVRFAYSKDDDMRFTGKRHPFKVGYKVGFTRDGQLTAVDFQLFSNGGCSADLSFAVLERAMLHADNTSYLPNVRIIGRVCKTNLPSNTAFRGFGGPQGIVGIENVIEEVARATGRDALDVRRANLYGVDERNATQYGQIYRNNVLGPLFDTLRHEAEYDARRAMVTRFNRLSKTHLKGLALSGVKFGISFTRRTLNQANALVNIYVDGSVMVSTGATEMGQGVYTRVRQIVADELGIGYDRVIVGATSTEKNNNTSPTAASTGTDLNGAAAADACRRLRERLIEVAARMLADPLTGIAAEPERVTIADGFATDERMPDRRIKFEEVVARAYEERVSLGERGFYATPGVDFNRETGKGSPFLYYTNGAACSEVLIDRFTGQMHVTRVDLLMDCGVPLNPTIDRGQVIGGFIQGMGWCTTEELKYAPDGRLLSYSPTTYKIPNVSDVPDVFNVRFFDNPDNTVSLRRSKSIGEPPLPLGLSVWLAVKNALGYVEPERARNLSLPATGEQILSVLTRELPLGGDEQTDRVTLVDALDAPEHETLRPSREAMISRSE